MGVGVGSKLAPLSHEVGIEDGENSAVVAIALCRGQRCDLSVVVHLRAQSEKEGGELSVRVVASYI